LNYYARISLIRKIIYFAKEVEVEYTSVDGASCPVCKALGLDPPKAGVIVTEGNVRSHRCPICQNTFRSVERTYPPDPIIAASKKGQRRKKNIKR
jgi:hypothetical protein